MNEVVVIVGNGQTAEVRITQGERVVRSAKAAGERCTFQLEDGDYVARLVHSEFDLASNAFSVPQTKTLTLIAPPPLDIDTD